VPEAVAAMPAMALLRLGRLPVAVIVMVLVVMVMIHVFVLSIILLHSACRIGQIVELVRASFHWRKMTVGEHAPPLSGAREATKAAAVAGVQAPPSPRSPLPESRAGGGSRFWALAGESSDEEEADS
jgi:hypothetical protein